MFGTALVEGTSVATRPTYYVGGGLLAMQAVARSCATSQEQRISSLSPVRPDLGPEGAGPATL